MLDIKNYYEQLVMDELWKIIENGSEELSQAFVEDVACLALNKLPPCYVRNLIDNGAHITDHKYQQMAESVRIAIAESIQQVRRHPHDDR